jgi:type IV pilus assembly protein PilO
LPRIVTVHDVNISTDEKDGILKMNATVKTYNEAPSTDPADIAKRKKRGKQ